MKQCNSGLLITIFLCAGLIQYSQANDNQVPQETTVHKQKRVLGHDREHARKAYEQERKEQQLRDQDNNNRLNSDQVPEAQTPEHTCSSCNQPK